jgi:hypothetical protein
MNDPVMGGQSYSQVEDDTIKGIAHFVGQCAIVPSLDAPGFNTMVAGGFMPWDGKPSKFPDISSCTALQLELKSNTDYTGYRLSFGRAHPWGNHYAFGYKTPLTDVPQGEDFGVVTLPFTSFSSKWDDATGNIQVYCQDVKTIPATVHPHVGYKISKPCRFGEKKWRVWSIWKSKLLLR